MKTKSRFQGFRKKLPMFGGLHDQNHVLQDHIFPKNIHDQAKANGDGLSLQGWAAGSAWNRWSASWRR